MLDIKNNYSDGDYLSKNLNWHQEDSPYKSKLVINALTKHKLEFNTCADLGCGAGLVTGILAKKYRAKTFVGYDLSEDVSKFWSEKAKIKNLSFKKIDLLRQHIFYDLIICLDVFEHVPNYYKFLSDLRQRGKYFIFNIPLDMSVIKLVTPGIKMARERVGHLHYFNKYTAIKTLEDNDYKIIDQKLCAPFKSTLPRNKLQTLILPFRFLSSIFGDNFASIIFGGYSLLVLAETK